MIYTVTMNPSLDYIVTTDNFIMGQTNRTSSEKITAGGKGINVSAVLKNLGVKSVALGFIAGFTGEEIKRRLDDCGIKNEFVKIHNGISRINVKIKSADGTEINASGPEVDSVSVSGLLNKLKRLEKNDILVLAGSVPASLNDMIYADIVKEAAVHNVRTIVDSTKDVLKNSLEYRPFLVKPNLFELGEMFNTSISNMEEAVDYAMKLKKMGAVNVIVSMGAQGALMIDEEYTKYFAKAPKGKLVSSVGAGDSMIAGFIRAIDEGFGYKEAFAYAVATGSATAFAEDLANEKEVELLYETVKVKML